MAAKKYALHALTVKHSNSKREIAGQKRRNAGHAAFVTVAENVNGDTGDT